MRNDINAPDEKSTIKMIKKMSEKLPKFPDGRIDYTNAETCLVISIFIRCKNEILILKRSDKVGSFRGKRNTVSGYMDEPKSIIEKAFEEIKEELGISPEFIYSIKIGKKYKTKMSGIKKTWIVHPVVVELKEKPDLKLDWEHTEFRWIKPQQIKDFDVVDKLEKAFKNACTYTDTQK